MRRTALGFSLVLTAGLLQGCQFAGNPTDGLGGFIVDTHTFNAHPNTPVAQSENEKLAQGVDVTITPMEAEAGNVWPGPPAPIPTLQDVQKLNSFELLPPPDVPQTPPAAVFPQNAPKP